MKMVIKRAQKEDADIIGEVHSAAWKQTYQGVFSQEYLDSDSPSARREEFLSSLNDRHCVYLLLKDDDQAAGIVKFLTSLSLFWLSAVSLQLIPISSRIQCNDFSSTHTDSTFSHFPLNIAIPETIALHSPNQYEMADS